MVEIDADNESKENEVFSDFILGPSFYFWRENLEEKYENVDFKIPSFDDLFKKGVFKPVHPFLLRTATFCSIVKGKNHEYLFLTQSLLKNNENQKKVCVLNPMNGMTEIVEIDSFVKSQQIETFDYDISNEISQIIMFNLCQSKTMMNSFERSEQRIT